MSRKPRFKDGDVSRRGFIKLLSTVTAGAIVMPDPAEAFDLDAFLQKHFRELSDEDKQKVLGRLETEYREKYDSI